MSHISLRDIYKSFTKNSYVIKGISLEIFKDEFIVFVGPSGCGKTTTLRMIAGLEEITQGELFIDGKKLNDEDPSTRNLNFVFQNYALLPSLSVYENIEFGLLNEKLSRLERQRMVENVAKKLGLLEKLGRYTQQLSGGERQRVALARALVDNKHLILFDEPLSNLDAVLRQSMRMELSKFKREFDVTAIYVTHDQIEAMGLSSRIVLMMAGEIIQVGTPYQMYYEPNHLKTALFMGSPDINVFNGKAIKGQFQIHDQIITLNDDLKPLLNQDVDVSFAIRAEDIKLSKEDHKGYLKVSVLYTEHYGSYDVITCEYHDQKIKVISNESVNHSSTLYLNLSGRGYLFDQSGRRLRQKTHKNVYINLDTYEESLNETLRELKNYGYQIYLKSHIQGVDETMNLKTLEHEEVSYTICKDSNGFKLQKPVEEKTLTALNDVFNELPFIK